MLKITLFSLKKIVKIAHRRGLCPQIPCASGGWGLRSQTPTFTLSQYEYRCALIYNHRFYV